MRKELDGKLEMIPVTMDISKKRRRGLIKSIYEEIGLLKEFIEWFDNLLKKLVTQ